MKRTRNRDAAFWNRRYLEGGTSGPGSVGILREWKWKTIGKYASAIDDVVDVGCGDRRFWEGRSCARYTGLDLSAVLIQGLRQENPELRLICSPAESFQTGVAGRVVICLDVLFHVLDDDAFQDILVNLTKYSSEWIFVYTWARNPFLGWPARRSMLRQLRLGQLVRSLLGRAQGDGVYQKYRPFEDYRGIFEAAGFVNVAVELAPEMTDGAMWIFRRKGTE